MVNNEDFDEDSEIESILDGGQPNSHFDLTAWQMEHNKNTPDINLLKRTLRGFIFTYNCRELTDREYSSLQQFKKFLRNNEPLLKDMLDFSLVPELQQIKKHRPKKLNKYLIPIEYEWEHYITPHFDYTQFGRFLDEFWEILHSKEEAKIIDNSYEMNKFVSHAYEQNIINLLTEDDQKRINQMDILLNKYARVKSPLYSISGTKGVLAHIKSVFIRAQIEGKDPYGLKIQVLVVNSEELFHCQSKECEKFLNGFNYEGTFLIIRPGYMRYFRKNVSIQDISEELRAESLRILQRIWALS